MFVRQRLIRIALAVAAVGMLAACGAAAPRVTSRPSPRPFDDQVLNAHNMPPALTGFDTRTIDTSTMSPSLRAGMLSNSPSPHDQECGTAMVDTGVLFLGVPKAEMAMTTLTGPPDSPTR